MERSRSGRRISGLALAALLIANLILPALLTAQALEATFADLKGEVQWAAAGSTQWETASANTVLHTGDRVRTTANSSARLAFYEGSTTDLEAVTGVRIDALQQADNENQIKLTQTAGVTQAQVQEPAATTTRYQVETPASVASAPPSTCPWVRVGADGTTLVRNYRAGVRLAVAPQQVQQVVYSVAFVPGWGGIPIPVRIPQVITVTQEMPAPTTADEQPLINCRFGTTAANAPDSELLAGDAPLIGDLQVGRLMLASLQDQLSPSRVIGQLRSSQDLIVTNTSGARTETVSVPPGSETQVIPGQPPSPPAAIGTFAAQAAAQAASAAAQQAAQAAAAQAGQTAQAAAAGASMSAAAAAAQTAFNQIASLANANPLSVPPSPTRGPATVAPVSTPTPTATRIPVLLPTASITVTITPTVTGTTTLSPTFTPTVTSTATPTPTATSTPTITPTATPTVIVTGDCIPAGAACAASVSPPAGPTASGPIVPGLCPGGVLDNCIRLQSIGPGFGYQFQAIITGVTVGAAPSITIPVVNATGTPSGSQGFLCGPADALGRSTCNIQSITGVFPQVGGIVVVTRP